jgi:glutamate synthase domain-containing protein 3
MLHYVMPRGNRGVPVIRDGDPVPHLGDLCTFGCRVVVRPPGPHPSKLEVHANIGNFLGYTATRTQANYIDSKTNN